MKLSSKFCAEQGFADIACFKMSLHNRSVTFYSQCRLQRRLPAHPNIVRVVDAFETPEEIVAAAEFVPGELHKQFDVYKASCMTNSEKNGKGLPESRLVSRSL